MLARLVPGRRDGFEHDLDSLVIRFQVGREATFRRPRPWNSRACAARP